MWKCTCCGDIYRDDQVCPDAEAAKAERAESRIAELEERVHRLEGLVIQTADTFERLRNLKMSTARTVDAGGAGTGATPLVRIDIRTSGPFNRIGTDPAPKMDISGAARTNITPCGRFRMETRTVPLAPTEDEMRAAKVNPEAPYPGQVVFTSTFGLLTWNGERWI